MEEIWKDIKGFEGYYQISTLGNVKSKDRIVSTFICGKNGSRRIKGRILSPIKDKDGYLIVGFNSKGYEKKERVHRLVAIAFIDNKYGYEQVNHIDGNKENNRMDNLEWCTNKYNQEHAYSIGLKTTKRIAKVSLSNSKVLNIYNSLEDATNSEHRLDPSTIIKVCRHKRNYHGGYKWRYATEDMKI